MKKEISVEELDALCSPDLEAQLDTYSVNELELLAIDLHKSLGREQNLFYLRRVMNKRCEKLNENFIWTNNNKDRIIDLNDKFFDLFKRAYDEACLNADEIAKHIKDKETIFKSFEKYILLEPTFDDTGFGNFTCEIDEVLLNAGSYSQFARIGDAEGLILYDFELDPAPYLNNREDMKDYGRYFGNTFDGVNLSSAFGDLISAQWSCKDIVSIRDIMATLKIEKHYWRRMDDW
jgi:hypothetical protein